MACVCPTCGHSHEAMRQGDGAELSPGTTPTAGAVRPRPPEWVGGSYYVVEQAGEWGAVIWNQSDSDASGVDYKSSPREFPSYEAAVAWAEAPKKFLDLRCPHCERYEPYDVLVEDIEGGNEVAQRCTRCHRKFRATVGRYTLDLVYRALGEPREETDFVGFSVYMAMADHINRDKACLLPGVKAVKDFIASACDGGLKDAVPRIEKLCGWVYDAVNGPNQCEKCDTGTFARLCARCEEEARGA